MSDCHVFQIFTTTPSARDTLKTIARTCFNTTPETEGMSFSFAQRLGSMTSFADQINGTVGKLVICFAQAGYNKTTVDRHQLPSVQAGRLVSGLTVLKVGK